MKVFVVIIYYDKLLGLLLKFLSIYKMLKRVL